jgi:hypothetical protein
MTNEEMVELFLDIASTRLTREQVERMLRNRVRPKS